MLPVLTGLASRTSSATPTDATNVRKIDQQGRRLEISLLSIAKKITKKTTDSRTGREEPMKKPTLRVTKWLSDIPVQATCTVCSGLTFRAVGSGHRPNREEYQKSLQSQFEAHCRATHVQD
jgi:hypothetical protein